MCISQLRLPPNCDFKLWREVWANCLTEANPAVPTGHSHGSITANRDAHDVQLCGEDGVT
jgi:hypothetical protein